MRMVFGLVLIMGLGLAGFAVYMVQGYLSSTETALAAARAEREKAGNLVEVYAVNKQLAYGAILTKEDVQKIYWQESALPEGVFMDEALLFPPDEKPRFVVRQMEKFEPILAVKITEPGEVAGITSRLSKGMRAFAVQVDEQSGVSGFVQPNDYVDIYWTGGGGEEGREITQLIESAVKVIAVDQSTDDSRTVSGVVANTVTVEATPEQIGRLAQAQATGRLSLSLVGSSDGATTTSVEVDTATMLGIEEEVAKPVEVQEICTVKERKGDQIVDTQVDCQ